MVIVLTGTPRHAAANALAYPQYTVDALEIREGVAELSRGAKLENVAPNPDKSALELAAGAKSGSVFLAPIQTRFPFNEALPSWNGWAPAAGGFRVYVRATTPQSTTPWVEAGSWGDLPDQPTTRVVSFGEGKYDVDTLLLNTPADKLEVRVDLSRPDPNQPSPSLRLFALSYTNSLGNAELFKRFGSSSPKISTDLQRLKSAETPKLPFRSQVIPNAKWIGRICAPSSVGMVLEHFGVNMPTQQVAQMLYDRPSDAFGVWNRSIQGGAQMGLRGYLHRMRSWDEVRAEMKKGNVICASIRFKHGECLNPPREYRKHGTEGHLIVIDGFAPGGKILVNNSATKDYGHDEQWLQEDLAKAWFDKGGVAYIFTPTQKKGLLKLFGAK